MDRHGWRRQPDRHNFGKIIGTTADGVYFGANTTAVLVNNHGFIFGGDDGVENTSDHAGGVINNYGYIRSPVDAIYLSTDTTLTTTILNAAPA